MFTGFATISYGQIRGCDWLKIFYMGEAIEIFFLWERKKVSSGKQITCVEYQTCVEYMLITLKDIWEYHSSLSWPFK